ncbi:hypothetical protein CVT91_08870, partial [Candidatus Atribacteria bacterium HGW-Atribacteria-1]
MYNRNFSLLNYREMLLSIMPGKKMEKKLTGLVPPMITPFREDESLDQEGIRRFADFLIEKGAQGLIPCGSSGEFITMTLEERKRVAEVVV